MKINLNTNINTKVTNRLLILGEDTSKQIPKLNLHLITCIPVRGEQFTQLIMSAVTSGPYFYKAPGKSRNTLNICLDVGNSEVVKAVKTRKTKKYINMTQLK